MPLCLKKSQQLITFLSVFSLLDNGPSLRQPRFGYFPLLGLLLTNLFTNTVLAKIATLGHLRIGNEGFPLPRPGIDPHYNRLQYWNAVSNPYGPPAPESTIVEGVTEPTSHQEAQYFHHYHHNIPALTQQQIVQVNEIPSEIIINGVDNETTGFTEKTSSSQPIIFDDCHGCKTNIERPVQNILFDEAFKNSNGDELKSVVKRSTRDRSSSNRKSNKYTAQRRRRPFYPDYFYDFEDRLNFFRRKQPLRRPFDNYDDSDLESEEESLEETNKSKKRKSSNNRKSSSSSKQKDRNEDSEDLEDDDDDEEDVRKIKQRQNTPTPPTTVITNGTTVRSGE